ncbi:MAG: DMT family transporter [Pseudomonadota bacterium]
MTAPSISSANPRLTGMLFVLLGALGFSTKAVLIKLAYQYQPDLSSITLMTLRMLMALPFFIAIALWKSREQTEPALGKRDYLAIAALGLCGYYIASFLDFEGLQYISAGLERMVLFLYPTLVVLLSAALNKRRIAKVEVVALLISYAGITLFFFDYLGGEQRDLVLGTALVFGSAVAFAVYFVGSAQVMQRIGSARFTALAMMAASMATVGHFAARHELAELRQPVEIYVIALLIALIATVAASILVNAGIKRVGAGPAAIVTANGPILTLLLAYVFLDETFTLLQLGGAGLVLYGVYLIGRRSA